MPLPLPQFNNQVDPTLPAIIKPALYYTDDHQSYDLLFGADNPDWLYDQLKNILPNGFIFPNSLIDRFRPFNYAWCEEYSTKLYYFWRYYSGLSYYRNPLPDAIVGVGFSDNDSAIGKIFPVRQFNRVVYISSTPYEADYFPVNANASIYPNNLFLGQRENFGNEFNNFPLADNVNSIFNTYQQKQSITLNIPASNKSITLTYLAKEDLPELGDTTDLITYSKQYKKIPIKANNYSLVLNLPTIACCSLIINCDDVAVKNNLEQQFNQASLGYLYSNLEGLFDLINTVIAAEYPRLNLLVKSVTWREDNNTSSLDYLDIEYVERKYWYQPLALIYGNNNYWNNEIVRSDINADLIYYPKTLNLAASVGYADSVTPNVNFSNSTLPNGLYQPYLSVLNNTVINQEYEIFADGRQKLTLNFTDVSTGIKPFNPDKMMTQTEFINRLDSEVKYK